MLFILIIFHIYIPKLYQKTRQVQALWIDRIRTEKKEKYETIALYLNILSTANNRSSKMLGSTNRLIEVLSFKAYATADTIVIIKR